MIQPRSSNDPAWIQPKPSYHPDAAHDHNTFLVIMNVSFDPVTFFVTMDMFFGYRRCAVIMEEVL